MAPPKGTCRARPRALQLADLGAVPRTRVWGNSTEALPVAEPGGEPDTPPRRQTTTRIQDSNSGLRGRGLP
eukprot:15446492-Alexandrium_andersonii.AAC.1